MITDGRIGLFGSGLVVASAAGAVGFLGENGFSQQDLDRQLGYTGADRFVCFSYEPRGQGVRWRDGSSSGSGAAWSAVFGQIEAVAGVLGLNIGSDTSTGDHVLLVDRDNHRARFVSWTEARECMNWRAVA